jgi:hypothetical protein
VGKTVTIPDRDSLRMPTGHRGPVHLLPLLCDYSLHHRRVWSVHPNGPAPLSRGNHRTSLFIHFDGILYHCFSVASFHAHLIPSPEKLNWKNPFLP